MTRFKNLIRIAVLVLFGLAISVPRCWAFGGTGDDSISAVGGSSITLVGGSGTDPRALAGQGATIPTNNIPIGLTDSSGSSLAPGTAVPGRGAPSSGGFGGSGNDLITPVGGSSITM